MDRQKKVKLVIFLFVYIVFFGLLVWLMIKFRWFAIFFLIFIAILLFLGVLIASKGKSYEDRVDSTMDFIVNELVKINLGTYDTIVNTIKEIVRIIKEIYIKVIVPGGIFIVTLVLSYALLLGLRYVNVSFKNGITYVVLLLSFVAPLVVNLLQYNLKSSMLKEKSEKFGDRVKAVASKSVLSSIELGLAFIFFFLDSTKAFFIPEKLREVPIVSYIGHYDLTLKLFSPHQLDFAFFVIMGSLLINFLKILLEKGIYKFYVHNNYINASENEVKTFKYTNLILTTLALHLLFLPFIRLKHLALTVGFLANLVADIFAALREREVWAKPESEPVDIVGQLNRYVIVPGLRKVFKIFSFIAPD